MNSYVRSFFYQFSNVFPVIHLPFERSLDGNRVCLPIFKGITKIIKKMTFYIVLRHASSTLTFVCFEPCFKVSNLAPVYPKNNKCVHMRTTFNVIFFSCDGVSLAINFKIRNWPQFRAQCRNPSINFPAGYKTA